MGNARKVLLEATITYLENQQRRGYEHVVVETDVLQQLNSPGRKSPEKPLKSPDTARQTAPTGDFTDRLSKLREHGHVPAENSPTTPPPTRQEKPAVGSVMGKSGNALPPAVDLPDGLTLRELKDIVLTCRKCPNLAESRTSVVFGVGNESADLMFIGEAPGVDEDIQGEPFVGKAGQLLTKIIQAMGLNREDVYIANILKCRPDTPGQKFGNRKPTPEEMATCWPYVLRQIELIQPKVIVALGATALQGLGQDFGEGITRARGNWRTFQDIPLMPTYHPSYLLHKESIPDQAMAEKRKVWEDMLLVMDKLNLPISDKQRGFFLKKK